MKKVLSIVLLTSMVTSTVYSVNDWLKQLGWGMGGLMVGAGAAYWYQQRDLKRKREKCPAHVQYWTTSNIIVSSDESNAYPIINIYPKKEGFYSMHQYKFHDAVQNDAVQNAQQEPAIEGIWNGLQNTYYLNCKNFTSVSSVHVLGPNDRHIILIKDGQWNSALDAIE